MYDSMELIERVLDGEHPEDVLDSLDEDIFIEDLLSVEYFNPYYEEWQTIDEIDEDLLDEMDEWDYREADLDEDEFYEKAGRIRGAMRAVGRGVKKYGPKAAAVGAGALAVRAGHRGLRHWGKYEKHVASPLHRAGAKVLGTIKSGYRKGKKGLKTAGRYGRVYT